MLDGLFTWEAACAAGALVSLVVGTFAHEFGHALAAWAVGAEPRLISLGAGPILLRVRLVRAWVVVRAIPLGGYVHSLVGPETTRRQRLVTIAGGPAANVLILGVSLAWACVAHPAEALRAAGMGWTLGQLLMLAGSLTPYQRKVASHVSISDGLRAYRVARGRPEHGFAALQAALLRRHLPEGAPVPAPSPHFAEIVFQRTRRDRKYDAWAQDDVADSMRSVLAQPDLPDGERSVAMELLGLAQSQQRLRAAKARLAALLRGDPAQTATEASRNPDEPPRAE